MRTGISFTVSSADRLRLERTVQDRNAAQKHVWRAAIILLSADGVGTAEIMRQTNKSKTCVWRWQERFMEEGGVGEEVLNVVMQRALICLQGEKIVGPLVDDLGSDFLLRADGVDGDDGAAHPRHKPSSCHVLWRTVSVRPSPPSARFPDLRLCR